MITLPARFYVTGPDHEDPTWPRRNLGEYDVPDREGSDPVQVAIEAWDGTPLVGLILNPDGTVTVGTWPDGEQWVELGTARAHSDEPETGTCRHCHRTIEKQDGTWVDPEAPATPEEGDDYIWRENCDANESFMSEHEPHTIGDDCLGQHFEHPGYLACGQSFMAGTICSQPAGHMEKYGTDHQ